MGYKYLPKKNGKIKKIENEYKGRIDIYKKIISSWKMPNCFDDGTDSTFGGGSKGLGPVMSYVHACSLLLYFIGYSKTMK